MITADLVRVDAAGTGAIARGKTYHPPWLLDRREPPSPTLAIGDSSCQGLFWPRRK